MTHPIRLNISPCPNDTFAFHAILHQKIDLRGLEFEIELLDIEELNQRLLSGNFDVVKASYSAAISVSDLVFVLESGSAIGFGVGPVLLSREKDATPESEKQTTLCPGKHTTAALLFNLFYGNTKQEHVVFSEIIPSLLNNRADFGVCIHEGRFTYKDHGLFLVEDLGCRWEAESGSPIPLGGLFANRDLDSDLIEQVQGVIRKSIQYGLSHRAEALLTMRKYAQEFDDRVLMHHVDLYINEWTIDLGTVGRDSILQLCEYSRRAGINSHGTLKVFRSGG